MPFEGTSEALPHIIQTAVEAVEKLIGRDNAGALRLPSRQRIRLPPVGSSDVFRPPLELATELSITGFFEGHWSEVRNLPEVEELLRSLVKMEYLRFPEDASFLDYVRQNLEDEASKLGWDTGVPVLEYCLQARLRGEKPETYLPVIIERIDAGAREHYFVERHSSPIIGLTIEGRDRVDLVENAWIRRLSPSERSRLVDPDDHVPSGLSEHDAAAAEWILEADVGTISQEDPDYHPWDPSDLFDWTLTILRLVKPGRYRVLDPIIHRLPGASAYSGSLRSRYFREASWHDATRLTDSDVESFLAAFQRLYPILSRIPRGPLEIAIRRFNDCYLRQRNEDAVLDAVISLEALFQGDRDVGSSYSLAQRAALLIERTLASRQSALKLVRRCYRTRNSIVHGESTEVYGARREEVEELARKSLLAFLPLLDYGSQRDVLEALDGYLLAAPTPTDLVPFVQDWCAPTYADGWENVKDGTGVFPAEPKAPEKPEGGESDPY